MHLDTDNMNVRIPVLISIEPQRFSEDVVSGESPQLMEEMVARGMRAKLQSGNLLTGQMFVSLDIDESAEPAAIEKGQFYANFPTSSSPVEELSAIASNVAEDLQATLGSVRKFMDSKQLDNTVTNFNTVLDASRESIAEARLVLKQLNEKTLPNLTANVNRLTDRLDKETLPRLTQDVSRITNRLDKETLPRLTQDVSRITNRLDEETLPRLTWNITRLSNRLDKETLPRLTQDFTRMTGTLNNSLQRVTATVEKTSDDFARASLQLNKTMQRLQVTLNHMDRLMARNSPTQHQVMEMLEEVTRMSRAVRTLTETLQQQPEALIRGRR